jgi:hypothetical protein
MFEKKGLNLNFFSFAMMIVVVVSHVMDKSKEPGMLLAAFHGRPLFHCGNKMSVVFVMSSYQIIGCVLAGIGLQQCFRVDFDQDLNYIFSWMSLTSEMQRKPSPSFGALSQPKHRAHVRWRGYFAFSFPLKHPLGLACNIRFHTCGQAYMEA